MNSFNDVDFQFRLSMHNSSQARLFIDGHLCEDFFLTNMFNEPIKELISATLCLASNSDEARFTWFSEPEQYDWKLTKVKSKFDLLNVEIYKYSFFIGYNNCQGSEHGIDRIFSFKILRDFWIELVFIEIEKIVRLLSYDFYKVNRNYKNFPWQEFKTLKQYFNDK